MFQTGLTSITFRQLTPEDIIAIASKCGLDGIEWGGDVHVPPGDLKTARNVKSKTRESGLIIPSYGSYYRCDQEDETLDGVLASANELEAPVIRIWAGRKGSAEADAAYRSQVVECLRHAVARAASLGMTIALEYHGGTLTDTCESAQQLLKEVSMPELKLYWQPRTGGTFETDLDELKTTLPALSHVHLFHWIQSEDGSINRRPLSEGVEPWRAFLEIISQTALNPFLIFEFVRNNEPQQLEEDSLVLRNQILKNLATSS